MEGRGRKGGKMGEREIIKVTLVDEPIVVKNKRVWLCEWGRNVG